MTLKEVMNKKQANLLTETSNIGDLGEKYMFFNNYLKTVIWSKPKFGSVLYTVISNNICENQTSSWNLTLSQPEKANFWEICPKMMFFEYNSKSVTWIMPILTYVFHVVKLHNICENQPPTWKLTPRHLENRFRENFFFPDYT